MAGPTARPKFVRYAVKHSFSIIRYFRLHFPNAEITLDLEVNEVEVKGLTSLASVTWITGGEVAR